MHLFPWYIFITYHVANGVLIERVARQDVNVVNGCLDGVIQELGRDKVIYLINSDLQVGSPVVRINLTKGPTTWFKSEKSDVCIINLNDDDLSVHLAKLFTNPNVNPRGVFLIMTEHIDSSLFTKAAKYHLVKLIVIDIAPKFRQPIYGYSPYVEESVNEACADFFVIGTCSNGSLENRLDLAHADVVPNLWRNTTINILNNNSPPYAICPSCDKDNKGLEIEIFDMVAQKLQFVPNFTGNGQFVLWGDKINGSYTNIMGDLQNRRGDMVIGCFHTKTEEHLDFDMTFTYMEDASHWIVPRATMMPFWKRLSLIFQTSIYLWVLCSLLLTVGVCYFLYEQSLPSSLITLYQVILEASVNRMPTFKIIFTAWTLSSLIISTAFKSKLIDVISKNIFDRQINSLGDIVAANLIINVDPFIASFYDHYANSDEEYVVTTNEICFSHFECVSRTALKRDSVTVTFRRSYEYNETFVDPSGEPLLHLVQSPVFPVQIHLFFVKGYPLLPQIDQILYRIKGAGFIKNQYNKLTHKIQLLLHKKKRTFSAEILTLKQMRIFFFLWGFGIIASSLVFLLEYCFHFTVK